MKLLTNSSSSWSEQGEETESVVGLEPEFAAQNLFGVFTILDHLLSFLEQFDGVFAAHGVTSDENGDDFFFGVGEGRGHGGRSWSGEKEGLKATLAARHLSEEAIQFRVGHGLCFGLHVGRALVHLRDAEGGALVR